jgi:hypothetical protein
MKLQGRDAFVKGKAVQFPSACSLAGINLGPDIGGLFKHNLLSNKAFYTVHIDIYLTLCLWSVDLSLSDNF